MKSRLGYNGFQQDIQQHPWLEDIDWLKVINRELKPDFVPDPNQQNYDFGAALEELLYEGSPLTKNPVRKRKANKNKPTLASLWNEETPGQRTTRNKLDEELDYIEEFFESYVKPSVENNASLEYKANRKNSHSSNSRTSLQNSSTEFNTPDMSLNDVPVLRKPVAYTNRKNSHPTTYKSTAIEEHALLHEPDSVHNFYSKSKTSIDLEGLLEELKPLADGTAPTLLEDRAPILPGTIQRPKDDFITKKDIPFRKSPDLVGRLTPPDMLTRKTPPPRKVQTPPLRRATPPPRRGTPDRKLMDIPLRTHSAASSGSGRRTPFAEETLTKASSQPLSNSASNSEPVTRMGTPEIPPRRADASGLAPPAIIDGVVELRPLEIFNNKLTQLDLVFPLKETSSPIDRKSYLLSPEFAYASSPTYEIESYFD